MSNQDPQVPPAGEDIHLPPGSLQPLFLTGGLTMTLIGLTWHWALLVAGIIVFAVTLAMWIRDAVAEYRSLPDHGDGEH